MGKGLRDCETGWKIVMNTANESHMTTAVTNSTEAITTFPNFILPEVMDL